MSILLEYDVVSIYGDQGLICNTSHADEKLHLGGFVIKPEKVERIWNKKKILWGGWTYTPTSYSIPKTFTNGVLGAFFSRQHWERKNSFRSVCMNHPERYKKLGKRLAFIYEVLFGFEFQRGELFNSFSDCGIVDNQPLIAGYHKLYEVGDLVAPANVLKLDLDMIIPNMVNRSRSVPDSVAKDFSKKRWKIYKNTPLVDDSVYRYCNPRLIYNNHKVERSFKHRSEAQSKERAAGSKRKIGCPARRASRDEAG
jgi:hypothetical protein